MSDIKSIYKDEVNLELTADMVEASGYLDKYSSYHFERDGVREKLIDISATENRLPTCYSHIDVLQNYYAPYPIRTPLDAIKIIAKKTANLTREVDLTIFMDENNFPIAVCKSGLGDEGTAEASFLEIIRGALLCSAKKILSIHNHPVIGTKNDIGQINPSDTDYTSLRALEEILSIFDIEIADSVILGQREITYAGNKKERVPIMYSIKEDRLVILGDMCDVNSGEDKKRLENTDHTRDFDEHGKRVRHGEVVLRNDGLYYSEELLNNEEEERELS